MSPAGRGRNESGFRQGQADLAQQVAGLQFAARRVADGVLAGLHRSVHRGGSSEFAEYKEYAAGDDPRTIDWKTVARTDRYFVKRFEETTNRRCFLLLDGSSSMAFSRGGRPAKLEVARLLLGAFAALLLKQGDAVGAAVLRNGGDDRLPVPARARRGHLEALLTRLGRATPHGRTDLAAALDNLSPRIPRRSLVVLATDLVDDPERVGAGLRRLGARGHDLTLLQVLDQDELEFPFIGTLRFRDPETGDLVTSDSAVVAEGYRRELDAWLRHWERSAAAAQAELVRLSTLDEPAQVLLRFLARRQALSRRLTAVG